MASQNEVHSETGNDKNTEDSRQLDSKPTGSTKLETTQQSPPPFSEYDPFRASRIDTLDSETKGFLNSLSLSATGIEKCNEDQLRALQEDAQERSRWSQTRQDAFNGILRLGAAIPPRDNRIL